MGVRASFGLRFPFLLSCVLLALVSVCGITPQAWAQERGGVTIHVVDERESPLSFAEVRLYVFGHGDYSFRGLSSGGTVEFQDVATGSYILEVLKMGYANHRERIDVAGGLLNFVTVKLQQLEPESKSAESGSGATVSVQTLAAPRGAKKEFQAGLAALGRNTEAGLGHFRKAIKLYPEYAEAYAWMGVAYLQKKQPLKGLDAATKAIAIDPRLAIAHIVAGKVRLESREFRLAEPELKKAVELDPASWQAPFELARCYFNMGNMGEALRYAKRAEETPQAPSMTHLLLVDIYMRQGDRANALSELDEFAKHEPRSPMLPRVRAMIQRLRRQK